MVSAKEMPPPLIRRSISPASVIILRQHRCISQEKQLLERVPNLFYCLSPHASFLLGPGEGIDYYTKPPLWVIAYQPRLPTADTH